MRFRELCDAAFRSIRTCPRDGVTTRAGVAVPLLGSVLGERYRILVLGIMLYDARRRSSVRSPEHPGAR